MLCLSVVTDVFRIHLIEVMKCILFFFVCSLAAATSTWAVVIHSPLCCAAVWMASSVNRPVRCSIFHSSGSFCPWCWSAWIKSSHRRIASQKCRNFPAARSSSESAFKYKRRPRRDFYYTTRVLAVHFREINTVVQDRSILFSKMSSGVYEVQICDICQLLLYTRLSIITLIIPDYLGDPALSIDIFIRDVKTLLFAGY